jgi:drug/metabolite transporter (DMT)-like permease
VLREQLRITNHKSRITGHLRRVDLAMLALVVIWGVNFPIVKITFREMPPMVFNAVRFAGATILLLLVLWRSGRAAPVRREDWPALLGLGLVGHSLYQILFINGLARTTASNSSLILAMVPLFVAMLSAALRIDHVAPRTWTGIVLAFAGLFLLVTGREGLTLSTSTLAGDGLTLLCTVCWALFTVFSRPFLRRYSPLQLTVVTMASGVPALVVGAAPQLLRQSWHAVSWLAWSALSFSTVLAVAVGYVVWHASLQAVGGPRTAVYSNLIPVATLIASWLLLGETLGALQALGGAIVLAGVSLARS